jgi:hypothetical protein
VTLGPDNQFITQKQKKDRRRKYLRDSLTEGLSQQLFQYQTLKARLNSKNKSLEVTILQDQQIRQGKTLTTEWLFEMESLMSWLTQHLEVKSVIFKFDTSKSEFPYFQFKEKGQVSIWQFYKRLRKLIGDIINLPQTSIFNARDGLSGPWLELYLAFDQRVCGPGAHFKWDHLKWGHYPAAGSLSLIQTQGLCSKNSFWMLNCSQVSSQMAYEAGIVHELLFNDEDDQAILNKNSLVSSAARIQLKKVLLEKKKHELNKTELHDLACLNGALESRDWLIAIQYREKDQVPEFQNPQQIKMELSKKESL